MKTCRSCHRDLPITCFHKDPKSKDGRRKECGDCKNKAAVAQRKTPINELMRKW